MVTIISTCKERLSNEEFVRPVLEILKDFKSNIRVLSYKSAKTPITDNKIIITGTALKDFDYLNYVNNFRWILSGRYSILGICAGAQILALLAGAGLENKTKIGVYDVKVLKRSPLFQKEYFRAYFLTKKKIAPNNNIQTLAVTLDGDIAAFKINNLNLYGLVVHPEVLNPEIILNFVRNL